MANEALNSDMLGYMTENLNRGSVAPFTKDYLGAVRFLEESGFSPYKSEGPLSSTLNQVFDRFVQKTGIGSDSGSLKNAYLTANPTAQRAMDLYSSLENTFSARRPNDQAAIVDFLNTKIDEYVTEKDLDSDEVLTLQESSFSDSLFEEVDADKDSRVNADELKDNFYDNYQQMNNVLNYFQQTPGVLVDVYG